MQLMNSGFKILENIKNYEFKSITKGKVDLSKVGDKKENDKDSNKKIR